MSDTNYRKMANEAAWDMAENFVEEMIDQWCESGEISDDINNDYSNGDSYHHETHCQDTYTLREAAELLEELDEYEEGDEGLWEGQSPRDAISTQAAFTYRAAVGSMFRDAVEELNGFLDDLFGSVDWEEQVERDEDGETDHDVDDLKHTAVKSWMETYVRLRCQKESGSEDAILLKAVDLLEAGDYAGVMVLADAEEGERGHAAYAMMLRNSVPK